MSPRRRGHAPGHIEIFKFDGRNAGDLRKLDRRLIERGLAKGYPVEECLGPDEFERPDDDNMSEDIDI